jgi:hypothetical protein
MMDKNFREKSDENIQYESAVWLGRKIISLDCCDYHYRFIGCGF